jgi:hypothetical protein
MTDQLTEQRMTALMAANDIRSKRAADKRLIEKGQLNPAQILLNPPDHWMTSAVVTLLVSMKQVGRSRAHRWLVAEGLKGTHRLQDLTHRQRACLAAHVQPEHDRRWQPQR